MTIVLNKKKYAQNLGKKVNFNQLKVLILFQEVLWKAVIIQKLQTLIQFCL